MSKIFQSAAAILAKSAAAYRSIPAFRGLLSVTPIEDESSSSSETVSISYCAGTGTDASFCTGGYGVTAANSKVYLTEDTHPGVYIVRDLDQDLSASLDRILGHNMFLPPQLVFRSQNDPDTWMNALGFGLISNLSPLDIRSGLDAFGRKTDIAEFQGDQGRVLAVFDSSSAHLLEASLSIADRVYAFSVKEETALPQDYTVMFDSSGRMEIASFSGFSGEAAQIGALAPIIAFQTLEGQEIPLKPGGGRWLILDFWALWCGPCLASMPDLDRLFRQLKQQDFPADLWTIALVESDNKTEAYNQIDMLWHKRDYRLPVLTDLDGLLARDVFRVRSIPATVVISPIGIVQHMGPGLPLSALKAILHVTEPPQDQGG